MEQFKISTFGSIKESSSLSTIFKGNNVLVEGNQQVQVFKDSNGELLGFVGKADAVRLASGKMEPIGNHNLESFLKYTDFNKISRSLEGSYLVFKIDNQGSIDVLVDRYARFEAYYIKEEDGFVISNTLDSLPVEKYNKDLDQQSLLYTFSIYGGRPSRQDTMFEKVKRVGLGEKLNVKGNNVIVTKDEFKPIETFSDFNNVKTEERYLNQYADLFLDSIDLRSSDDINVVYLSSGWDSTSLLAGLVHLHGPKKVKAVIGRMHYSERSKVINIFEIERAQAIAEHFGIDLDIVNLDHLSKGPQYLEEALPIFKNNHFMNFVPMNWYIISKYISEKYGREVNAFCGEISDGVHNLGFSQFTSIFHTTQEFREYSDKMKSYLFGPSFMKVLENGNMDKDVIYNTFKNMMPDVKLDNSNSNSPAEFLLSSFFLGAARFPGYDSTNEPIMTNKGRSSFNERMVPYIKEVAEVANESNIYSCYNHLYNNFHWQGSTVKGIDATAKHNGINTHLPFWDSRLQDFMSSMPETWGRGLDLNPTKYPLKWTLKNRIDNYPFEMQVGPHSYTYDVDHSFNLSNELIHHSSYTPIFKDILKSGRYAEELDGNLFDLDYIKGFVNQYLNGNEVQGKERDYLFTLCLMQLIQNK